MTPNCKLLALILYFSWLEGIYAAAFSNVVVQRGPVEYVNYNPSALSFSSAQLAQLSSSPLEQVVSIPALSPCVSPCVIPNRSIPALAPLPSMANAKIIGYRSTLPNVPVLLANKDEATGYQYAYAVFDEQTGDKKTQSEQSDGSVVQGQYSFVQPDGFRRVVVYTADDVKGYRDITKIPFNAVVRNISPEQEHPVEGSPEVNKEINPAVLPCTETKNERLTHNQASEEGSEENNIVGEQMDDKKSEEKTSEKVEEHAQEDPQPQSETKEFNTNIPNAIISYNEIINCLQAKLRGTKNIVSPLTYVLIPSSRSPC